MSKFEIPAWRGKYGRRPATDIATALYYLENHKKILPYTLIMGA
jgi:hypothetical protein